MVDVLLIISSAIEACCARPFVHGCDQARATYCFNSGGDCLSYVESLPDSASVIALVDSRIRDISPLNLVNALRTTHEHLQAIIVVASNDTEVTQRAMLAGACSAVYESCGEKDLDTLITKVVKSSLFRRSSPPTKHSDAEGDGCAVVVASARGGSGKTYVSTLLAATMARAHKETLLLDGDIQFSDLGLLFPQSQPIDRALLEDLGSRKASSLRGLAYHIVDRLNLIRFDASPLHSEVLASKVVTVVRMCRRCFDATIINTGGFWSLYQSNLLESCNCIVVTCDHTLAGIKATQQLLTYFDQLRIPLAQVIIVISRFNKRGIALKDIEETLGSIPIVTIAEFPAEARMSLDAGQPQRVLEEFDAISESCLILAERISEMTGMPLRGTRDFAEQFNRRGWLQRVFAR